MRKKEPIISNFTNLDDDKLRFFMLEGLLSLGINATGGPLRELCVKYTTTDKGGFAYMDVGRIELFIYPGFKGRVRETKELAQIFIHEMGHLGLNLDHPAVVHYSEIEVPWVKKVDLRPIPAKPRQ